MRCGRIIAPDQVTETVSVTPPASYEERSAISYVDFVTMKRFSEEVNLARCLTPVAYRDTIVCYTDSIRKRFTNQTLYEPRVKPRKFRDTLVIFPKRAQKSFVTCLDYHIDECRRWFKTTVEFKAKTYTTTKIVNDSEGEEISDTDSSDDDVMQSFPVSPGASQIFIPRWNANSYDENKNIPHLVNGEILLNGF